LAETEKIKDSRGTVKNLGFRMLKNFKDLNVWQKAFKLCLNIYKTTKDFPIGEKYGLSSQTRRAAV
jgi:hypothetical protein